MSDRVLSKRFSYLSKMLKESGVPEWSSEYFVEDFYVSSTSIQTLRRDQLHSIDDYSDRFESLLRQKHSWINMSGLGLLENNLIIGIEKPGKKSPSYKSGAPNTSVNFSGPMRCVQEKGYDLSTFIRVKE